MKKILIILSIITILIITTCYIFLYFFLPDFNSGNVFCHCKFDNFRLYPDESTGKWVVNNDVPYKYDKIFLLNPRYHQEKYHTDLKFKYLLVPENITMKQYYDCKYGSKECDKLFNINSGYFGDYFIMEDNTIALCECRK